MKPIWTRAALAVAVTALVLSATGITIASPHGGAARATKAVTGITPFATRNKTLCHDSAAGQAIPDCALQNVVAVCPKGQVATGGAVHNDTGRILDLNGYIDAYEGVVYNTSQTDAIKISAIVYCAKAGRVAAAQASIPAYSAQRSAAAIAALRTQARS